MVINMQRRIPMKIYNIGDEVWYAGRKGGFQ